MSSSTIKNLITKLGKGGGTILAFMTVESYGRGLVKDLKVDDTVKELINTNANLRDMTADLRDEAINNMVQKHKIQELLNSGVLPKFDKTTSKLYELKKQVNEEFGNNLEMKNSIMDALKELESSTDEGKEFVKRVLELVNDKGSGINDSNQFIPWDSITNVYSEVYEVIDSLSQTQKGAVIHISFSLVILFCLFTLIGVFYGEKLIQYFKLEEKFPRLARYINLRRKFQQFYFLMNSLFILFILIFIIIFNVIIFIYAP